MAFKKLAETIRNPCCCDFELLFIDNDSQHPIILSEMKQSFGNWFPNATVLKFSPQLGWAGARNEIIKRFMQGSWERLVMMDHDIVVLDPLWLNRIDQFIDDEPDLNAFMLLGYRYEFIGETVLPRTKKKATVCREFTGAVNIISRKVPSTVGGYNTTDFPLPWGWHDIEFGERIVASGLLSAVDNKILDPIMAPVVHLDPNSLEAHNNRSPILEKFGKVFSRRVNEIHAKKSLYHPY
jgi:GT2 family glycosyltransferase